MRLLYGDPDCDAVASRGQDEGIGDGLAARIRLSLSYMQPVFDAPGVEARLHATTLYNSIFRFDNEMLINSHAYGAAAAQSPVLHVRRTAGNRLFDHYLASFERVWAHAIPVETGERQLVSAV